MTPAESRIARSIEADNLRKLNRNLGLRPAGLPEHERALYLKHRLDPSVTSRTPHETRAKVRAAMGLQP